MVKKILIIFSLILAFIIGGLGSDVVISSYPVNIESKDAKMFQEAKLYLDTSIDYMSKNWWCSGVLHQNDSTFFFFEEGELPNIRKTKLFGFYENVQFVPYFGFPMNIVFFKGVFVGGFQDEI